jgi:hypothetical protein
MIGEQAMQSAKKRTKWTVEEVDFLRNNHLKLSYNKIAKCLGKTYSGVNHKITRLGIGDNTPKYKYTLKKDALRDPEVSGYLAGIWAADGHLNYKSNQMSHKFHVKDSDYLKQIYSLIINEEVSFYKDTKENMVVFRGTIPSLRTYLQNLGITPKKTHTLSVNLLNKPHIWVKSFISGYLDGDGWVYLHQKRYEQKIGFVSSGKILYNIQEFLGYGSIYKKLSYSQLVFPSKHASKLANYLKDNKYQFPRKKEKLNTIIDSFGDAHAPK